MKKLNLSLSIIILASGFFILASFLRVLAQTSTNYDVTVSPVFFDLTADPGTTLNGKIRIRNNTSSPLPIKLGVERLTGDLNGNLILKQSANDTTLSWITFAQNPIVAKPLEWTDIPFSINIPKDAAYGYYWTITFTQDKTSPLAKTGVSLTGAAGIPVLLDVRKAGAKADVKLLNFSVSDYVNEYLPVDFTVRVENIGNVHVQPHGSIFISDGSNKNLAVLDINPNLGNVIPQTARIFNSSWDDGFIVREPVIVDGQAKLDKNGKPLETLKINWNKLTSFRIGRYTANLLLVYDNGTRDVPIEDSLTFWVFPYKVIIFLIVILAIIILLIKLLLSYYVNREVKRKLSSEKNS